MNVADSYRDNNLDLNINESLAKKILALYLIRFLLPYQYLYFFSE